MATTHPCGQFQLEVRDPRGSAAACYGHALGAPSPWPSIELSNFLPRQRIDYFNANFVLCCYSNHHKFLLEVRLRQCVFCKEPWSSWSSSRCRSFGPSGSEYEYCVCPIPLFLGALKLVHEKNSRVRPCELEQFHPQHSPQILLTILADHATGFSVRSRCLHFCLFLSVLSGSCDGLKKCCATS